jgi:hypothetical protein
MKKKRFSVEQIVAVLKQRVRPDREHLSVRQDLHLLERGCFTRHRPQPKVQTLPQKD